MRMREAFLFLSKAVALGVGGDLGVDLEGESESRATGLGGDAGWRAGLDGV